MRASTSIAAVALCALAAAAGCGDRAPSARPTVTVTAQPSANPGAQSPGTERETETVTVEASRPSVPATPLPLRAGVTTRVTTETGKTTCNIRAEYVECQSLEFLPNHRTALGGPASGFRYTGGALEWLFGNMSVETPPTIVYYGHTYTALGWTVESKQAETVFTRDGHGVRVSFDNTVTF